jgi:predicted amidohydrolase
MPDAARCQTKVTELSQTFHRVSAAATGPWSDQGYKDCAASTLSGIRAPLTIAVAQPRCTSKDVRANALEHAAAIRRAGARLVVFPELSLTGYELDADPVVVEDAALSPIVEACAETGAVALVGAPVAGDDGSNHIATLRVDGVGVQVAYRKQYLGGDEPARFARGDRPVAIDVDGWRVGLGICKDTGVAAHVADVAALGVDVYAAGLVHLPDELAEQEERAATIARACHAYVAFASFAGATGGGYDRTAGVSSIWSADGTPLVRAGVDPGEVATFRAE